MARKYKRSVESWESREWKKSYNSYLNARKKLNENYALSSAQSFETYQRTYSEYVRKNQGSSTLTNLPKMIAKSDRKMSYKQACVLHKEFKNIGVDIPIRDWKKNTGAAAEVWSKARQYGESFTDFYYKEEGSALYREYQAKGEEIAFQKEQEKMEKKAKRKKSDEKQNETLQSLFGVEQESGEKQAIADEMSRELYDLMNDDVKFFEKEKNRFQ